MCKYLTNCYLFTTSFVLYDFNPLFPTMIVEHMYIVVLLQHIVVLLQLLKLYSPS